MKNLLKWKLSIVIYLLFFTIGHVKSQTLNLYDSSQIISFISKIDTNKIKVDNHTKDIPKYILKEIKYNKKRFKLTDNSKNFVQDVYVGRRRINRLLEYVIVGDGFFLVAYKFGGFVSNTKLFYITIVNGKVDKLLNFTVPQHNGIGSLITIFKTPGFELKSNESYYW